MTYVLLIYRASAAGSEAAGVDEQAPLRKHRALQKEAADKGELQRIGISKLENGLRAEPSSA